MQSILTFNADLQMAKRRLRENDCGPSPEHSEDAPSHQEPSLLKRWKGDSMYERRETTSHGVLSDIPRRDQNRIE